MTLACRSLGPTIQRLVAGFPPLFVDLSRTGGFGGCSLVANHLPHAGVPSRAGAGGAVSFSRGNGKFRFQESGSTGSKSPSSTPFAAWPLGAADAGRKPCDTPKALEKERPMAPRSKHFSSTKVTLFALSFHKRCSPRGGQGLRRGPRSETEASARRAGYYFPQNDKQAGPRNPPFGHLGS